jgi:hypothetical protein
MLRTLLSAALAAALAAAPASAAPAKGKAKGKEKHKDKDKDEVVLVFDGRHRDAYRSYWTEAYGRGNCPPGLAKKHNGCLPPGQAKKRYVVGHRLPATVIVQPLPPVLVPRLGPAPRGYEYVMVDGDVLKLAVGTRLVVDALNAIID